jgi:hypothetical protein
MRLQEQPWISVQMGLGQQRRLSAASRPEAGAALLQTQGVLLAVASQQGGEQLLLCMLDLCLGLDMQTRHMLAGFSTALICLLLMSAAGMTLV